MPPFHDALIVGAGFGGIHQLQSLLTKDLDVKLIEKADGPGGTWYWNRYPGAMSDSPSHLYRYSWDKEDLLTYPWPNNYVDAKEARAYLHHVIDRHDLRKHMHFNTELLSASWNETDSTWTIETTQALGIVTEPNYPAIPDRSSFKGEIYHTARWPDRCDLSGKKVAVIGNGSSGVQLITSIAPDVGNLILFQRHAQYSVPAGNRAVSVAERGVINERYDEIWAQVRQSIAGMGVVEGKVKAMSVSAEERERVYQAAWDEGGAFRFFVGTFADLVTDEAANRTACEFIKGKIAQIVADPEKRRKLTPRELYARRPVCDRGYFEQFNRRNVDVVDIARDPIVGFTAGGLRLGSGVEYQLDVIICATGYDAFDGPYKQIDITGRGGTRLKDHWEHGPSTNLGLAVAGFPNLFMVYGPQSPLSNVPPVIEAQVQFIVDAVARAEQTRQGSSVSVVESKQQGEKEWGGLCQAISDATLFKTTESYFFGRNIEGKADSVYVFLGGLGLYLQKLKECQEGGYSSFHAF
ncbi:hypothetical protein BJX99DRAFT_271553 [Aspergillus californicus]